MSDPRMPYIHAAGVNKPELIREFLTRPVRNGGILLLVGQRGTGKSRLVDEALNQHDDMAPCWHWAWWCGRGRDSRVTVLRRPKQVRRYLIQVDVDPYFPQPNGQKADGKNAAAPAGGATENAASLSPCHANDEAFQLIRNLLFALTSTIDPRMSARVHGRTMFEMLGFWRYWFSPRALLLREMDLLRWSMLLAVSIPLQMGLLMLLQVAARCITGSDGATFFPVTPGAVLGAELVCAVNFLLVYAGLRWLDWRALAHMSAKLYDLIHAQDMDATTRQELSTTMTWTHRWALPTGVVLVLAALALGHLPINPATAKEKPVVERQSAQATAKENNKENTADGSADILQRFAMRDWQIALIGLLVGAAVLSLALSFSSKKERVAHFSANNPVWMITLLRRYLYLMHRCGIEPVLVFDELDKLELCRDDGGAARSDCLLPFLNSLLRLKHCLGAEFLWILVGGPGLYSRLQKDRHNHDTLGPLATLVQQDIVLGPMDFAMAEELCGPTSGVPDAAARVRWAWLRSHGNFSTLLRERAIGKRAAPSATTLNAARRLAECAIAVWTSAKQAQCLGDLPEVAHHKLEEEWNQAWIHCGILELANSLLTLCIDPEPVDYAKLSGIVNTALSAHFKTEGNVLGDRAFDARFANPSLALQVATPEVLIALGKFILFSYLIIEDDMIEESPDGLVQLKNTVK